MEILLFSPNFSVTVSEKRLNLPWVERKSHFIATTALVATASVAAAEVRLSGYARFGAQYNEGTAAVAAVGATAAQTTAVTTAAGALGIALAAVNTAGAAATAAQVNTLAAAQDTYEAAVC